MYIWGEAWVVIVRQSITVKLQAIFYGVVVGYRLTHIRRFSLTRSMFSRTMCADCLVFWYIRGCDLLYVQLSELRQQLLMTRDVAYEEVQMRNRQLTDKLEQMEKYIQAKKEVRNIYKLRKRYVLLCVDTTDSRHYVMYSSMVAMWLFCTSESWSALNCLFILFGRHSVSKEVGKTLTDHRDCNIFILYITHTNWRYLHRVWKRYETVVWSLSVWSSALTCCRNSLIWEPLLIIVIVGGSGWWGSLSRSSGQRTEATEWCTQTIRRELISQIWDSTTPTGNASAKGLS